ncbi:MAG TPA: hypothetical protein VHZ03_24410 [Trebonia sp.]|jgi:hypothetical protein|nr:hypothetical protein [Trebonia sp.]
MARRGAVHRTIVVMDIAESTHPDRTDDDRLVMREAMYDGARCRLRVAVHAGEVTLDGHEVVGAAVDHTFRLAEAPPLKSGLATSTGVCALIANEWAYACTCTRDTQRTAAFQPWLHTCDQHRAHAALGGHPPVSCFTNLSGQNN